METTKLMKIAQRLDTYLKVSRKILGICLIVAVILLVVASIALKGDPDAVIGENLNEIDVGPYTFILELSHAPSNGSILTYSWIACGTAILHFAVYCYAVVCVRRILTPVMAGKPFYSSVGKDIRKLGYVWIAYGIVGNIATFANAYATFHTYGLSNLATGSPITDISVNCSMDASFLIGFFVLLILSYIFEYGTQLQKLSDETL